MAEEEYCADYEIKKQVLKKLKVALWDSIGLCEREGSMDADIKNEIPNDIRGLLKSYPSIEKIAANNYQDIYYLEKRKHMPMLEPQIKMSLRDAFYAEKETIRKEEAIGRISAEVVAECPPGISILLPGELITEEHLPYLNDYKTLDVVKQ